MFVSKFFHLKKIRSGPWTNYTVYTRRILYNYTVYTKRILYNYTVYTGLIWLLYTKYIQQVHAGFSYLLIWSAPPFWKWSGFIILKVYRMYWSICKNKQVSIYLIQQKFDFKFLDLKYFLIKDVFRSECLRMQNIL